MDRTSSQLTVHKFGGTSLKDYKHFQAIQTLIHPAPSAIVVSATAGTTSQLQHLLSLAASGEPFFTGLMAIKDAHLALIEQLITAVADKALLTEQVTQDTAAIATLLENHSRLFCLIETQLFLFVMFLLKI